MEKKPNWLFMVYMVAGDSDRLDSLAVQDLLEMERGVANNDKVQCFVMVHRKWPADPQRYLISKPEVAIPSASPTKQMFSDSSTQQPRPLASGTAGAVQEPESSTSKTPVNMAEEETLRNFLLEALREHEAKHYCLVLWGHSYGLGFGREHGDKLTLGELNRALKAFEDERRDRGYREPRLELLGANTCTLAYAEAIFELRDAAKYMIASEVFVPFAGWPYTDILSEVTDQSPDELGSLIANRYVDFYNTPERDERVAMTLLDLEKVEYPENPKDDLATVIENLGNGIKNAIEGDTKADKKTNKKIERLQRIRDAFLINPSGQIRPVLDLTGLADDLNLACDEIEESEGGKAKARVRQLRTALEAVERILPKPPDQLSASAESSKLVLMHKCHPELSELNGVGIFAPFVVEPRPLSRSELAVLELSGKKEEELKRKPKEDYLQLGMFLKKGVVSKSSPWPEVVFERLRPDRPAEIVDSAGVVRPSDRSAVSQMVFAVDAAFRRLSRALALSKPRLVSALKGKQTKKSRLENAACFGPPNLRLARDRSLQTDPKTFGRKRQVRKEPTEIVDALQAIEEALSRVERITRRVVTDAQFGIGPAATPSSASGGFDDTDKTIGAGFLEKTIGAGFAEKTIGAGFAEKTIGAGFAEKTIGAGFAEKTIGAGFAEKTIGAGFGPGDDDSEAASLGSRIAFVTADARLGALAVLHLFQSIARAFDQVELAVAGLEDEVAAFLDPEFGVILSKTNYEKAIEARIQRRFAVVQETGLQALRVVRSVLAHPTFGLGPGPASIGRGDREALAAQAGLGRQRLLLL